LLTFASPTLADTQTSAQIQRSTLRSNQLLASLVLSLLNKHRRRARRNHEVAVARR
jgi:hypothetical protein